jgi:RNA polymerase sigma factor (sigma-70 family)
MRYERAGSDRNIVEGCINKDLICWDALISKYSRLIYISIEKRLKKYGFTLPPHDIEDIRQNVLAAIWKEDKLKDVSSREDISYWFSIVAGNAAMAYMRKPETRNANKTLSLDKTKDDKNAYDILASATPGPDGHILRDEMEEKIDKAICGLSSKEKIIIKLTLFHEKKQHEIAEMTGLPEGTVSSCIKRAKDKLKGHLRELK